MEYEVDFLPVGEESKGGDAIALRIWNPSEGFSSQFVMVIDGGTKNAGEALVEHIKKYYDTEDVDAVLATHCHSDHTSGLSVVLEKLKVKSLYMHKPWEHSENITNLFKSDRVTGNSLEIALKKSLETTRTLESIAKKKGIPIIEPFSDGADLEKSFVVLSPSVEYYRSLLPNFAGTPEPKESASISQKVISVAKEAINWIRETWGKETLTDPEENDTSSENNSSVILLLQVGDRKLLFTADAGVGTFNKAFEKGASLGLDFSSVNYIQVPHHGSKRNIGPTILNALVGPILSEKKHIKTAYLSAPKKGEPKHPSGKVINAFKRRGAEVFATKGVALRHRSDGAPEREGRKKASPVSFYDEVAE